MRLKNRSFEDWFAIFGVAFLITLAISSIVIQVIMNNARNNRHEENYIVPMQQVCQLVYECRCLPNEDVGVAQMRLDEAKKEMDKAMAYVHLAFPDPKSNSIKYWVENLNDLRAELDKANPTDDVFLERFVQSVTLGTNTGEEFGQYEIYCPFK